MATRFLNFICGNNKEQHLLICLLCCQTAKHPHYLPCDHFFCVECLKEYCSVPSMLASLASSSCFIKEYCCPICLKKWTDHNKLTKQPKWIKKLMDSVQVNEKKNKGHKATEWKCSQHKMPVNSTCNVCMLFCCEKCNKDKHEQCSFVQQNEVQPNKTYYDSAKTCWSSVLDSLVETLNHRGMTLVQLQRLRTEHESQCITAKEALKRHTKHVIEQAKTLEAEMIGVIEKKQKNFKEQSDTFEKLCHYNIQNVERLINYVHEMLSKEQENSAPVLMTHSNVQGRSENLHLTSTSDSTEYQCLMELLKHPVFDPQSCSVTVKEYKTMPIVSYIERTLENVVETSKPVSQNNNKRKISQQQQTKEEELEDSPNFCETNGTSFHRLKANPEKLVQLYTPLTDNVEPTSAVYLPDGRLVVAERKAHQLAVWKKRCKEKDYDIKCDGKLDKISQTPDHIQPYVVCYDEKSDYLFYTNKRHFTIGFVQSDGEDMGNLNYELIRDPFGVDKLQTGHLVSTDIYTKSIKLIDPNKSTISRSIACKKSPTWVTVLHDGTFVVTQENELYLYDKNGYFIDIIGSKGEMNLLDPGQVIQDSNNQLLIADAGNKRVLVYDVHKSNTYCRTVIDKVDWPKGLAFDRESGEVTLLQGTGVVWTYDMYQTLEN